MPAPRASLIARICAASPHRRIAASPHPSASFAEAARVRLWDKLRSSFRRQDLRSDALPRPPNDWRDVEGWNAYWRANIERSPRDHLLVFDVRPVDAVLLSRELGRLMRLAHRRVLVVGNGITLIPRMFCHAGFQAVALDISSVATEFARDYQPTEEDWRLLFQLDERGHVGEHFERFAREGGALDFVCGDLFESPVAPGPFDLIWSPRSLQGFDEEDMAQAITALDARLRTDGECHVLVQNSGEKYERIVSVFAKLGYAINPEVDRPGKKLHIGVGSG